MNGNAQKLEIGDIKALSHRDMRPWLKDALIDWAIIILSLSVLGTIGILFLLPAILIIGNRQHALTVLGHEGAHFTLSHKRALNDTLTNLFAFWPLGITVSGYRNLHLKHHKYTSTEQDPEIAHRKAREPQWDLPISLKKILEYCAYDLIGNSVSDYIIIVTFSKPGKRNEYVPLILLHTAFIVSCLAAGLWWAPLAWYVPLITSFMMFFRLRTFLEHLGTDDTHRLDLNWWQRHLIAPHNIWYHWEHHNYPTIPYYNLKRVRNLLPSVPIISLNDLLKFYQDSRPIPSGTVLKAPVETSSQMQLAA